MTSLYAEAQYQVMRVNGNSCVGMEQTFVFTGSSCSITWVTNGTKVSEMANMVVVKWNSPTTNAYVQANYSCPTYPYSGTAYSPTYAISSTVTPSVSLSSNYNNVCETTNITFTASPVHGGSNPLYQWKVNGNVVSSTSNNTYSTSGLKNGDVVQVVMTSNATCTITATATSNNITMNLTPPAQLSVTVDGPQEICSNDEGSISFGVTVTNGGSSLSYSWYKNDAFVTDHHPNTPQSVYFPQNPLNDGDRIKCQVSSSGCVSGPAEDEYTVVITPAMPPAMTIGPSAITLCDEGTVQFYVSSNFLSPNSSYSWRLDDQEFSMSASPSLPVSIYAVTGTFHPDAVVTVTVDGLTGVCLTSTTTTASTSQIPFSFKTAPNAAIDHQGAVTLFSHETSLMITAATGPGYTYQWYFEDEPVPGPSGTANPFTAVNEGRYKVQITQDGYCEKESSEIIFSINSRPVANAGPNPPPLVLPTNSITLNGSGSDTDGTIVRYFWSKKSGPTALFSGEHTDVLTVSYMQTGTYEFELTVTDDVGETSLPSTLTVVVEEPLNNYNYIKETVVLQDGVTDESELEVLQIVEGEKGVTYTYYDDIGRPSQTVVQQGSPTQRDIAQPIVYDQFGREAVKYLPYTSGSDGWYKTDFLTRDDENEDGGYSTSPQYEFYQSTHQVASDVKPYSVTVFEPSPLNRVLKQGAPGTAWQPDEANPTALNDHSVKMRYETNGVNDVLLLEYDETAEALDLDNGLTYYDPNELYANKTFDEHNNEVSEYVDKEGRTVLKRVQYDEQGGTKLYAETYYIYDDFGNLVMVLPPEGVKQLIAIVGQN